MTEGDSNVNSCAPLREAMVVRQLQSRGVYDARVLAAFRKVARHLFVPGLPPAEAYADHPLPIGHGQTISQPYIVAAMLQCSCSNPEARALEIGTGSGYQTALLAELCREVYTVERVAELADAARRRLAALGYLHVRFRTGDGTLGWIEHAPYDAIVVSAAAPKTPRPLLEQLADGGRMVIPVGNAYGQDLLLVERKGAEYTRRSVCGCVFVKLIGEEGWGAESHEE